MKSGVSATVMSLSTILCLYANGAHQSRKTCELGKGWRNEDREGTSAPDSRLT
jgi:hypothetical protein